MGVEGVNVQPPRKIGSEGPQESFSGQSVIKKMDSILDKFLNKSEKVSGANDYLISKEQYAKIKEQQKNIVDRMC